jgi:FkbH-like protein
VPAVVAPETYIETMDRNGYFEVTGLSDEDLKRGDMYKANIERARTQSSFDNYEDYLKSLEMEADIGPFPPVYMERIAELTNKSNQFNLTTKRCSRAEIEAFAADPKYITRYGRLEDKFGDNGVVAVSLGHEEDEAGAKVFIMDLWLMSCRVLKRGMEYAMMDEFVKECKARGIAKIRGCYYPTAKNKMVREFYKDQGFDKVSEDEEGNSFWELDLSKPYESRNIAIKVN